MKHNYFTKLFQITLVIIISWSCATVDYVGESYPQTTNIDIYYSNKDITNNFKIIGYVVGYREDYNTIISKIIEKAKMNGADAIVITGIDVEIEKNNETNKVTAELLKYFK